MLYLAELSIIWTVCCVPVVTIGPATAALYYSVVKAIRKERSYPVKKFMSAFRENLKNGAAITAVLLVVGISSGIADYLILLPSVNSGTGVDHLLMFLLVIKIYLFAGVFIHSFPLVSRFRSGIIKTLENAFYLVLRHLFRTIALFILLIPCGVLLKKESLFLAIVPGVYCLLASFVLEPMYQKYYTKEDLDGTNGIEDSWYDNTKAPDKNRDGFHIYRIKADKEDTNNNN